MTVACPYCCEATDSIRVFGNVMLYDACGHKFPIDVMEQATRRLRRGEPFQPIFDELSGNCLNPK